MRIEVVTELEQRHIEPNTKQSPDCRAAQTHAKEHGKARGPGVSIAVPKLFGKEHLAKNYEKYHCRAIVDEGLASDLNLQARRSAEAVKHCCRRRRVCGAQNRAERHAQPPWPLIRGQVEDDQPQKDRGTEHEEEGHEEYLTDGSCEVIPVHIVRVPEQQTGKDEEQDKVSRKVQPRRVGPAQSIIFLRSRRRSEDRPNDEHDGRVRQSGNVPAEDEEDKDPDRLR